MAARAVRPARSWGCPTFRPEFRPPFLVTDVGAEPVEVRQPGHPAQLRRAQAGAVRADRRAAAQHRADRNARMTRIAGHARQVRHLRASMMVAVDRRSCSSPSAQYRTGSTNGYSAVFTDASRLETGDTVRVAGIRVGTVTDVSLRRRPQRCWSKFDADRDIKLTTGTKAAIRYLNLSGDRYLELVDGPGSTQDAAAGIADPDRPHAAGARPRPAARRAQAGHPGPEPAGRQRAHGVADPGLPGPGRHARLAAGEDVVVHQHAGRQQPGRSSS